MSVAGLHFRMGLMSRRGAGRREAGQVRWRHFISVSWIRKFDVNCLVIVFPGCRRAGREGDTGDVPVSVQKVRHHCGVASPLISMPCCWSCARSSALSFFNSSICCLSSSLSISTRSTSLKLSCSRWLLWRSSRM